MACLNSVETLGDSQGSPATIRTVFAHLSPLELRLRQRMLDRCADAVARVSVAQGKSIYSQGDNDRTIYFLERGAIRIGQVSPAGREVIFHIVRAGQLFGETLLLGGRQRSEEARALEDSEFLSLPLVRVRQALVADRSLVEDLLEFLSLRVVETRRHVADLAFYTNSCRLVKVLLEEARSRGAGSNGVVRLRLGLTHEQLGQMIGTSREIVTTILNHLRHLVLLDYDRGCYTIFAEKLERYFDTTCVAECGISVRDSRGHAT